MKKKIFDVLVEIKAEIFKMVKPSYQEMDSDDVLDNLKSNASLVEHEHEQQFVPIDGFLTSVLPLKSEVRKPPIETCYFSVVDQGQIRRIAYSISGDIHAKNILVCLPGLLETKESFLIVHSYFLKFDNCKVISIDFSGRGDSDYIEKGEYKMSLYLSDISQLIQGVLIKDGREQKNITILGTSMGGVLAMYLTKIFGKEIYGIILNDIALTVNWTSLYALYKSMKKELGFREVRELAKDLGVDQKAISDVQLPGHFDLSYRADIWGMNFHETFNDFQGKVALVYGENSKICTKQRIEEAKSFIPHLETLEVFNVGHPAPFNLLVCDFIQSQMNV